MNLFIFTLLVMPLNELLIKCNIKYIIYLKSGLNSSITVEPVQPIEPLTSSLIGSIFDPVFKILIFVSLIK
jgi:hypothetical protein